jgi:aminoglycoside 6'-N-acetyltransferase
MSFIEDVADTAQDCPNCSETLVVPREGAAMAGPLPVPMETERLVLRRFRRGDWKDLLEVMGDAELCRYLEAEPAEEEQIVHWLEANEQMKLSASPTQSLTLGIELRAEAKLIGHATIWYADENRREARLTLALHRRFHRQGYGWEAVKGLLGFGFEGLHAHRMAAYCDGRAAGCRRMLAKAGLRQEGEFLQDRWVKGEWISTVWYGMLAEEYEAR